MLAAFPALTRDPRAMAKRLEWAYFGRFLPNPKAYLLHPSARKRLRFGSVNNWKLVSFTGGYFASNEGEQKVISVTFVSRTSVAVEVGRARPMALT